MILDPQIAGRLDFAVAIARAAGDVTLRYFRTAGLTVERKADKSPVTIADRSAEQLMRDRISESFPHDAILGEEMGSREGTNGFQWVLDPIDGTKSFIHGVPLFTTLVAVLENDEPRIGVIHAPATGETVYAAKGSGCWYTPNAESEPEKSRVSNVARLEESLLVTTEIESFKQNPSPHAFDVYLKLQSAVRFARTWGDGYGYLMVATGRAEIMIDPIVNLWDAAPLQTVIEEAGGTFTDWSGKPTIHTGDAIATNGLVANEVLAIARDPNPLSS
jgi:histidinol phosphatase-like enzyme (inositol monophosphatase family)